MRPPSPLAASRLRRLLAATAAIALALVTVAATSAAPATAEVPTAEVTSATVIVSATNGLDPAGQVVTVNGSGFDPTAHTGTRPPLMGQPSGVYVVFGRFGTPWQPSLGAPGSARNVLSQVWALPQASHDVFDPDGSNPQFALLAADGTFSVPLEVKEFSGTGAYGIAVYPASGAVNSAQEVLIPVEFGGPTTTSTTTTSTTSTSTTSTSTTTPTTTSTTTTTVVPSGSQTRSATGPSGQTLTVTPADDLDPDGATVAVTGCGFDTSVGIYVALCVDQGAAVAPSPCVGGVDMEGSGTSSAWVTSDPPDYGVDLSSPFGPGGTFDLTLELSAADEFVDCLDPALRCVVASRADHTASSERSADVKVPVYFEGQTPPAGPAEPDPEPTAELGALTVAAGGTLRVTGVGFMAGEQTQIWLLSDPVLLAVAVADDDGDIAAEVTIPGGTPPGEHHIELRGLTSGRTVRSSALTVTAAPTTTASTSTIPATVQGATTAGPATPGDDAAPTSTASAAPLAVTGSSAVTLAAFAGVLLALGAVTLRTARARSPHPVPNPTKDHR